MARQPDTTSADAARLALTVRPGMIRELALGLATFGVYLWVEAKADSDRLAADEHGRQVLHLERLLRLNTEIPLNDWLARHDLVRVMANYEYATTYVLAAFGLLFWLYARRPELYPAARTSFILLNLLAFACFLLYPLTPPRLLNGSGFIDTVAQGHTWGSWGSPLVSSANQLAAMPSLHLSWALWVSAVLARIAGGRLTQAVSALHVLVTTWVILATGNHYLLDAIGAIVLVVPCALLLPPSGAAARADPVASADAFFLHVESARYPHQVGGVVRLEIRAGDQLPSADDVIALVQQRIDELPRFRQRVVGLSLWRRHRWVDEPDLDWRWHVIEVDLASRICIGDEPDEQRRFERALDDVVGELATQALPRDRPMWRLVLVHGADRRHAAVVLLVHHVIADGIGTIAQALRLLDTRHLEPAQPASGGGNAAAARQSGPAPRIGPLRRLAGIAVGLAQLATDGAPRRWPQVRGGSDGPVQRSYARLDLPLIRLQAVARAGGVKVTEVLLCAVAGALARVHPDGLPATLRVTVPLTVRQPGTGPEGNVTAAVMVRLPTSPMPERERLRQVSLASRPLSSGSRALAARFVTAGLARMLPEPAHRWFARTVYGRRLFLGIVSNMPGPRVPLDFAGHSIVCAFPLLPVAPGTALAVGAIGWNETLCISAMVPDVPGLTARTLIAGMVEVLAELGADLQVQGDAQPDRPPDARVQPDASATGSGPARGRSTA